MIFILIILFCIFLEISDFSSYHPYMWYALFSFIISVIGVAHIVLLSTAVYRDTAVKKLGAKWIWTILTFLLGIPLALFYALFTHKVGKYNDSKEKRKNIILAVISLVFLVIFYFSSSMLWNDLEDYSATHFNNNYITYKNASGEEVIYDKMGNDYTFEEIENMTYYDRDGNSYNPIIDYELFGDISVEGYICIETRQEYSYDYQFAIDRDGYFIIFPFENELEYSSLGVLYDDDKNIYYFVEDCYWTPQGSLIFHDGCDYNKITYQDILDRNKTDKAEDLEGLINNFFYLYEKGDCDTMGEYDCSEEFAESYINGDNVFGFKSAKLIEKIDEGYVDGNENKYYLTAKIEGAPTEDSDFYDPNNKKVTVVVTITVEYINNTAYDKWLVTDIRTDI